MSIEEDKKEEIPMDVHSPDFFKCRFYEKKYPDQEELVVVQVKSIQDMGAYTNLLEYNGIEGMILLSELSRKRIRSINKLIRVGREEIVMVLRVDEDKGYIDLSKSRVQPEEIDKAQQRYQKSKAVHGIMLNIAKRMNIRLETIYQKIGWPLYKEFGHAFKGLKLAMKNPDAAFKNILTEPEDQEMRKVLVSVVKQRLKPKPVKLRADVQLICFEESGIKAIQEALRFARDQDQKSLADAKNEVTEEMKICLVAPPLFVMQLTTLDKALGLKRMNDMIENMKTKLEALGGKLTFENEGAPRVVSEKDEHSLAKLMESLEEAETTQMGLYDD